MIRQPSHAGAATLVGNATLALLGALALASPAGAQDWTPFDAAPAATCADGSAVHYLERVADPTRVVLFFEGGGGCFDAGTCAFDGPDKAYASSSEVTPDVMAQREGILDFDNAENPLRDHSFVYVPYCTGDVHVGDRRTAYAADTVVEHRGYPNARHALDHLVATYPDATELVVAGMSAGSIPTPLFAGLAADLLPEARIVQLGDSSGAYPGEPPLNATVGALWNTLGSLPDWPETVDVTVRDWGVPSLYRYAGAHAPRVIFGKFDHAYDEAQTFYAGLVGVDAADLLSLIDGNEAEMEAHGTPVASYVAPGTGHTLLDTEEFYELEVEGVRFVDWVTRHLAGEQPDDVHCQACR